MAISGPLAQNDDRCITEDQVACDRALQDLLTADYATPSNINQNWRVLACSTRLKNGKTFLPARIQGLI
ncbi:MAG: hypothetical protein CME55_01395 [Halieaceae bacterium]|nr:hypothetical protein [Halieaceae bacterium]